MKTFLLFALLLVIVGAAGCAGKEHVLHMREFDISRDDLRKALAEYLLLAGSKEFCQGLEGLSDQEVADTLASPGSASALPPGAIARPGQTPYPEDARNAAGMLKEECARLTG